ncbi:MAG: polymer-forming cytoskeletal protein [Porticoccus sp.]
MRKKNKSVPFVAGNTTLIAGGTHVIGDIHFSGNLEVEGRVTGNVVAEEGADARVRILPDGKLVGEVRAPIVIINGHIEGNIYSSHQVELADKAVVEGNLHYVLIEIEKGAQVNGSFVHQATEEPSNVVPLENTADSSQEAPGL